MGVDGNRGLGILSSLRLRVAGRPGSAVRADPAYKTLDGIGKLAGNVQIAGLSGMRRVRRWDRAGPKGAAIDKCLAASLKRCPDTNMSLP